MTHEPVRLGIIGCGGISNMHGTAAALMPDIACFRACCDINEKTAQAWAQRFGAAGVYTDYLDMVRREDLDGVLLATWPNQHRQQVEELLGAGVRRILCEKALALTGREAVEIHDMAADVGAVVMEGFMYRHHPAIRTLFAMSRADDMEPIDNVRACFSAFDAEVVSASDQTRDWRQRKECGGGIPYDFACYAVNACGYLIGGMPVRVYATGSVSPVYDTINRLYGLIEYADGKVGIIESSKKSDMSQEVQVSCAHGRLSLPVAWTATGKTTIGRSRSTGWVTYIDDSIDIPAANPYQLQLENFAAVIRGNAVPVQPLRESVVNTFVIEALVTSLYERRPVEITLPPGFAAGDERAIE